MVLLRYPPVGELTCGGSLPAQTYKRDYIKMKDYIDRRVTPSKRVTSPTWGPPPSCKQALSAMISFGSLLRRFLRQNFGSAIWTKSKLDRGLFSFLI